MLNFSKTVGYGMQVLSLLGEPGSRRLSAHELAEDLSIPKSYLAKVINQLSHTDLIDAQRGPGGGLVLKRLPCEISLYEVVQVFDPTAFDDSCLLGMDRLTALRFCPCRDFFGEITDAIVERLQCLTIADLIQFRERAEDAIAPSGGRSVAKSELNGGLESNLQFDNRCISSSDRWSR